MAKLPRPPKDRSPAPDRSIIDSLPDHSDGTLPTENASQVVELKQVFEFKIGPVALKITGSARVVGLTVTLAAVIATLVFAPEAGIGGAGTAALSFAEIAISAGYLLLGQRRDQITWSGPKKKIKNGTDVPGRKERRSRKR